MAGIPPGRYDANLGDIMQDVQQIDKFLDVVFEFLYRRTDFYLVMKGEDDRMGLPPGIARRHVMQAFMKYERISQGNEQTASKPVEEKSAPQETSQDVPVEVESVVEVTATETSQLPGSPHGAEASPSGATSNTDVAATADPSTATTSPKPVVYNPDTGEVVRDKGCSSGSGGGGGSSSLPSNSKENTSSSSKSKVNPADTFNGALRDNYAWSQTLKDVDIKVFVPETVRKGKQLTVDIKNDSIKVALKGGPILAEGQLKDRIRGEESMWSLDPGNAVQLNLEKRKETWWKAVFVGEPEIDQKSIDNTQYVHEMDEQSQADYQRVMYDMERKRQGLPTSKEEEAHTMLKKAWNAEGSPFQGTDFDPEKVNISAS